MTLDTVSAREPGENSLEALHWSVNNVLRVRGRVRVRARVRVTVLMRGSVRDGSLF